MGLSLQEQRMQPGDYFVTATGGFVGWAIRKLTHSPVNHAGIYMGNNRTVEAKPEGVVYGRLSDYPHAIGSTMSLGEYQRQCIETFAALCIGRSYNFMDIAVQAIVRVFRWKAPKWAIRRLGDPSHLQCAQLVDYCFDRTGIELLRNTVPGLIAPADLYNLIDKDSHGQANSGGSQAAA